MAEFSFTEDILDIRDIIERYEELEKDKDYFQEDCDLPDLDVTEKYTGSYYDEYFKEKSDLDIENIIQKWDEWDDKEEFIQLSNILEELCGNGGDEEWKGDWYPITLINEDYFEDYAQELAEDIGAINKDSSWPNNCIDWKQASKELQMDYTSIEIGDETYWYR